MKLDRVVLLTSAVFLPGCQYLLAIADIVVKQTRQSIRSHYKASKLVLQNFVIYYIKLKLSRYTPRWRLGGEAV
jgi:hypothetical protein